MIHCDKRGIFPDVHRAFKFSILNFTGAALRHDAADFVFFAHDLREIQELVEKGTIPGAKHVPRGMLEFWADPASPYGRDYFGENKRTIVFCAGGGRSVYAVKALEDMGYTNVAHLSSGFGGWEAAGESIHDFGATSRWVRREES